MMIQNTIKKVKAMCADRNINEFLAGASSSLLIQIFGSIIGVLLSLLVTNLLGAAGAGIYFLALSVVAIASRFGRLGFDYAVVRFVASCVSENRLGDARFIHATAIRVVAIASFMVGLALFLGAEWIAETIFGKQSMEKPLRIVSFAVLPFSLAMIQAEGLRGLKRIPSSQWIKTVSISLVTLLLLYPFVKSWGVDGALIAYVCGAVLSLIIAYFLWIKAWAAKVKTVEDPPQDSSSVSLFESIWPLFLLSLTGLILQQAGTISLGIWGTEEDVGLFYIANRIASLLAFPLMAVTTILAPKFAEFNANGNVTDMKVLARRSSGILTFFAIMVSIPIVLWGEWILGIFGAEFKSGVVILHILLIGVVVNAASGAVAELLVMTGHEKDCRNISFIGALTIVFLSVFLTPVFAGVGAAAAVAAGISVKNLSMAYMVRKRLGFWPLAIGAS